MNTTTVSEQTRIPWRAFSIVLLGTFLGPMGGIIVGVALPTIQDRFHAGLNEVKWVLMIYLLVTTFLLPVTGWLGRRFGEARLFTLGFAIDGIGTLLSGFVPETELWLLIVLRVVQAIGSALVFALFSALVTRIMPADKRGLGFGIAGAMVGISLLISPPLGGILCEYASWRWVFFVQVPLQLAGLLLSMRLLPHDEKKAAEPLPWPSVLAWFAVTTGLVLVAEAFDSVLWAQWLPWTLALCLAGLAAFIWSELKLRPLFDYSLFRSRAFALSALGIMLINLNIFVMVLLAPFYLKYALGYEASQYGRLLAISPLFSLLIAPYAGRLSDRRGFRVPVLAGLLLGFGGFALMAQGVGAGNIPLLSAGLALLGLAGGLFNAPALSAMMGSACSENRSRASSIGSLARNLGFMAGTSLGSILFALYLARYPAADGSYSAVAQSEELLSSIPGPAIAYAVSGAFWVCCAIAALTLLAFLRFPNRLSQAQG